MRHHIDHRGILGDMLYHDVWYPQRQASHYPTPKHRKLLVQIGRAGNIATIHHTSAHTEGWEHAYYASYDTRHASNHLGELLWCEGAFFRTCYEQQRKGVHAFQSTGRWLHEVECAYVQRKCRWAGLEQTLFMTSSVLKGRSGYNWVIVEDGWEFALRVRGCVPEMEAF